MVGPGSIGREPDMSIRLAGVEDAAVLDHFFRQLDGETRFMLYEGGERPRISRGNASVWPPWQPAPISASGSSLWTGRC